MKADAVTSSGLNRAIIHSSVYSRPFSSITAPSTVSHIDDMDVLIVEDDAAITHALNSAFVAQGDRVYHADNAATAQRLIAETAFTALILDLGLPDQDGLEVLRVARQRTSPLPTLIMTARESLQDRVRGLDAGADDYLVKPFEFAELMARLRAVLRRCSTLERTDQFGAIERRPDDLRFFFNGEPLPFTPREHAVFDLLWTRRERLVSKRDVLQAIDPYGSELVDPTVDVYMHRLRKKLEGCGVTVNTMRGFGYLLQADPIDAPP
jgi:DNA-binding response OmpR family regulator